MKLSVVIPVFNEKDTIRKIIEKVRQSPVKKEIIIIDDGSNDGTKKLLQDVKRESTANYDIKILHLDKNLGKGLIISGKMSRFKGCGWWMWVRSPGRSLPGRTFGSIHGGLEPTAAPDPRFRFSNGTRTAGGATKYSVS